ncbi:hypothetical protein N7466_000303 [Penicillium verhagenii]|uniref:uncharacterized protein n=1 Tax=Penicillium verhagenii TaxID=1562060 RepID=UPI0025456E2F|nr:uncharacterized protein N7466_000303 [Penicillium verhagenii]KAJ5947288.1 hypothetical protein N7466_000303 [Penicillium verhagenii]
MATRVQHLDAKNKAHPYPPEQTARAYLGQFATANPRPLFLAGADLTGVAGTPPCGRHHQHLPNQKGTEFPSGDLSCRPGQGASNRRPQF